MRHRPIALFLLAPLAASVVAAASAGPPSSSPPRTITLTEGSGSSENSSQVMVVENGLAIQITTTSKTTTDSKGNDVTDERTEMKVTLDGKEVPPERIRRVGNTIEVLDESGNVIRSAELPEVRAASGFATGAKATARSVSRSGSKSSSTSQSGQQPQTLIGTVQADSAGGSPKVMLGVSLDQADDSLAKFLKLAPGDVTVFTAVTPDTPAAKAGLQAYDVVISVDGQRPASPGKIREALRSKSPGDHLKLTVVSGGQTKDVDVTLEAFDPAKLGQPMQWTLSAPQSAQINIDIDDEMKELLEHLRSKFGNMDADFDWQTMFAPMPVPPAPPGAATPPHDPRYYRFVVPGPDQGQDGASDRIRELEQRIEQLNETIRRLEQRLGTPSGGHSAPEPPPPPRGPRA